jgi:hypothetical protein
VIQIDNPVGKVNSSDSSVHDSQSVTTSTDSVDKGGITQGTIVHKPRRATRRTCWTKVSRQFPKRGGPRATFILATGANTGKLQKANQDAVQFKSALQKRFSVPNNQVCLLKNVYRAEFERALRDLKRWLKPDDRVIIFFSGHGSYVRDDNGDEKSDRLDEVFVTRDVKKIDKPKRKQVVTDDRLVQLVNALPTQRVITFIDACHAGGMYMDPDEASSQVRAKFFAKGELGTFPRPLLLGQKRAPKKVGGFRAINGILFAASKEYQKAWEDKKGGVFTTIFLKQLKRYPRASLKRLFGNAAKQVRKSKRPKKAQHPICLERGKPCR